MKRYIKKALSRYYFYSKRNIIIDKYKFKKYKLKEMGENIRVGEGWHWGNTDKLEIENDVFISNQSYIDAIGGVKIKSGTMIGPRFTCISANHVYNDSNLKSIPFDDRLVLKPIEIGENVWIGACVSINPGVKIGEGAIVGMGVIVYKDVPPYSIVVGNPMKIINYRDIDLYNKLKHENKIFNKVYLNKPRKYIKDEKKNE